MNYAFAKLAVAWYSFGEYQKALHIKLVLADIFQVLFLQFSINPYQKMNVIKGMVLETKKNPIRTTLAHFCLFVLLLYVPKSTAMVMA